jgi:hypothetical protein
MPALKTLVFRSNRATLGTNMPLRNGTILVDRIRVGRGAEGAVVARGEVIRPVPRARIG